MPGDISRKLFDPKKRYSGVRMQQGRVQLDADFNEQLDIYQYRLHTETRDVIGACGVPMHVNGGAGFKITVPPNLKTILIDWGRIYVDGLLCELENVASYFAQPFYPGYDATHFTLPASPPASPPGSPVGSPVSPPDSPLSSPLSPPQLGPLKDGAYIAYLDAWEREITYLDDARIQEVALGGPDTTTRVQTVWQVKLLKISNETGQCDTYYSEWDTLTKPSNGMLNVRTQQSALDTDPCDLPPSSGYRRVENQLYRIEVHRGGSLGTATFKWSRDNATVETAIVNITGNAVEVKELAKDEVLGFSTGNWVEIIDEESSLNFTPSQLYKIDYVDPATNKIFLFTTTIPNKNNLKIRRWDQNVLPPTPNYGIATGTGWIDLEDGIQVQFSPGTYKTGEYWLVPARTATNEVEWPPYQAPNTAPQAQRPLGTFHHYCKLAVIHISAGVATVIDCRPVFSALTDQRDGDCGCTFTVKPEPGWEAVFNRIGTNKDAHICFQAGTYPLTTPVLVPRKGHLKLSGAGMGTKIIIAQQEAGLVFENCASVIVRDLYVETSLTGALAANNTKALNGGLNFKECALVHLDTVGFKNGRGQFRAATCLTIHKADIARVLNCMFHMAHLQQGMLLVNVDNAIIENNHLSTYGSVAQVSISEMLQDPVVYRNIRAAFMPRIKVLARVVKVGGRSRRKEKVEALNVILDSREELLIQPEPETAELIKKVLDKMPQSAKASRRTFMEYLNSVIDDAIKNIDELKKDFQGLKDYNAAIKTRTQAISAQAITVGGTSVGNISITNNTIVDVLQGIHVGVSHHAARDVHDFCDTVVISNNTVKITLSAATGKQGRHGIFAGNCKDLLIENNKIQLERLRGTSRIVIDGIRVWGVLGNKLMVTKNTVHSIDEVPGNSFDIGINVHPLRRIKKDIQQWIVSWNLAPSKIATVELSAGVIDPGYVRTNAASGALEIVESNSPV